MKNTRKCKYCKERFTPRFNAMQPACEKPECVIANHNANKEKQRKKQASEWKKEKKERKDKIKTTSEWNIELEDRTREIVRLIDKGHNCISCNAPTNYLNPAQSGHRWSKGNYPTIRFHLLNMWVQGSCCNKHKSGNLDQYDDAILAIYGQELLDEIKYGLRQIKPLNLTVPEIKEKIEVAKQIIKELKALNLSNCPSKLRLELRLKYNERLGLYPSIKENSPN